MNNMVGSWHGGKGDKVRTADGSTYRSNYDLIDWGKGEQPEPPTGHSEPVEQHTESLTTTEA